MLFRSVDTLTHALEEEHEIKREVCTQVMKWFGEVKDGFWKLDELAAVKEVGLGVLRAYKVSSKFMRIEQEARVDPLARTIPSLSLNLSKSGRLQ